MGLTATNRVKAKMTEFGLTQVDVAKRLGISKQAFSSKLHNKREFKASEIESLCRLLAISDKNSYFFCEHDSQNG